MDPSLARIIAGNRAVLNSVPQWITDEHYASPPSLFNYGLPPYVRHLVDLPLAADPTEADVIMSFMDALPRVRYLEVGVSVGKTFYQMARYAQGRPACHVAGLDIEAPNPVLVGLLDGLHGARASVACVRDARFSSMRDGLQNQVHTWGGDAVRYYEADEFDGNIWNEMQDPYNVVFSDAMHNPRALVNEYFKLKHRGLLDYKDLVYAFDDVDNADMLSAVRIIAEDIGTANPQARLTHMQVNGWLGQHEAPHNFAVIASRVPTAVRAWTLADK